MLNRENEGTLNSSVAKGKTVRPHRSFTSEVGQASLFSTLQLSYLVYDILQIRGLQGTRPSKAGWSSECSRDLVAFRSLSISDPRHPNSEVRLCFISRPPKSQKKNLKETKPRSGDRKMALNKYHEHELCQETRWI